MPVILGIVMDTLADEDADERPTAGAANDACVDTARTIAATASGTRCVILAER